MNRSDPLETRTPFLFEEWTEAYNSYAERNTAEKNGVIGQDFLRAEGFALWQAERLGSF